MVNDVIADNAIDVLVLTETWHISGDDLPLRQAAPAGYSVIDVARPDYNLNCVTNHGGIAVIHRQSYVVRIINTHRHFTTFESLTCHLVAAASKLVLVAIYRPPSQSITATFFEELTSLLSCCLLTIVT